MFQNTRAVEILKIKMIEYNEYWPISYIICPGEYPIRPLLPEVAHDWVRQSNTPFPVAGSWGI